MKIILIVVVVISLGVGIALYFRGQPNKSSDSDSPENASPPETSTPPNIVISETSPDLRPALTISPLTSAPPKQIKMDPIPANESMPTAETDMYTVTTPVGVIKIVGVPREEIDENLPVCDPPDDCGYGCNNYDFMGQVSGCKCIDNSAMSPTGNCLKPGVIPMSTCSPPDDCGYGCIKYDFMGIPAGCGCIENSAMAPDGKCLEPGKVPMPTCTPPDDCGYGCNVYNFLGVPDCKCMDNSELSDDGKCLEPVDTPDAPPMPTCSPPDACGYGCMKFDFMGSPRGCDCIENSLLSREGTCLQPYEAPMSTCSPPDDCGYGCMNFDFMGTPTSCNCIDGSKLSDGKCLKPTIIVPTEIPTTTTTIAPLTNGYLVTNADENPSVNGLYMEQLESYNNKKFYISTTMIPMYIYFAFGRWYFALTLPREPSLREGTELYYYYTDDQIVETAKWSPKYNPNVIDPVMLTKWDLSCNESDACGYGTCTYTCDDDDECPMKCKCDSQSLKQLAEVIVVKCNFL